MSALAFDTAAVRLRPGEVGDLDALLALEQQSFASDRLSRRSFRNLLTSPNAALIVADCDSRIAGYALVLFRPNATVARLYSIAVAGHGAGRGFGPMLLAAAEEAALERSRTIMRLEVHERNERAIARYRKAGYHAFGRRARYYQDGGDALRFEKRLVPRLQRLRQAPPRVAQTTEFTCGPACILMAMSWADPTFRPPPGLEFSLWREATTIFTTSGHGGCDPFGMATALRRRRLYPEVFASDAGPFFLDTVRSDEQRRVMRLTQADFCREAVALGIPSHLTPLDESALMAAIDDGAVAIVLVWGYHMVPRRVPHWVFVFGHEDGYILLHDPLPRRDENGQPSAPQTYAIPKLEFERMTRSGRDGQRAAILIRKGPHP